MNEMRSNKILSGTIIYTLCNLLVGGLAIITSPIFTRMMSVGDYGIYSMFNSWNNMIFCISSLGFSYAIAPAKREYGEKINSFVLSVMLIAVIIPIFLFIVSICGGNDIFADVFSIPSSLVYLFWMELGCYTIIDFETNKLAICDSRKEYVFICLLRAIGSTILSIIIICFIKKNTYYGRVLGVLVISVVLCIEIIKTNFKYIKDILWAEYLKFALKLGVPMIFHGLAMVVLGQVDRIMIIKTYSEVEAGLYSYGYSIATMIMFVLNAVNLALKPWLFDNYGRNNISVKQKMDKIAKIMMLISILYILVSNEIIKILADRKYWGTVTFVYPIVVACFCQFLYSFYSSIETMEYKTQYIAIGSAVAALVNGILNYYLLSKFGYEVAAITTLIGYFLLLVFHMMICRFVCKVKAMNYQKNFLYVILMLCAAYVISLLHSYWIMRYILSLGLLLFIYFKYRKEIIAIIERKD